MFAGSGVCLVRDGLVMVVYVEGRQQQFYLYIVAVSFETTCAPEGTDIFPVSLSFDIPYSVQISCSAILKKNMEAL